ncbi:MAG: CHAT domain-containing protein [Acidobacteriota bacterium]
MNRSSKTFAVAALVLLTGCHGDTPAERMRSIAPRAGRTIEARLTGFGWSAMRVQRASRTVAPLEPARLELAGAAGAVIEKTPGSHDAGVGYLVIDRDADAVEALQEAAQKSPNDAKIWSDLAAARYTLAVREDKPYELPRALAGADRALRINATLPDALFNRALIIERLGITEAARRAWQRYLQADGTSKWADEALQHLGRLDVVIRISAFKRDLDRAQTALRRGNPLALAALTRMYPQEARAWGEGPLLAAWAKAVRASDPGAVFSLELVRNIAHALTQTNQEQLLDDTVAVITASASNVEEQRTLADAHLAYDEARVLYSRRRVTEAEVGLRNAATLFARAGSPMALVARYYAANAVYDQSRAAEARTALKALLKEVDARRYRALAAQIGWQLSLCAMGAGEWAPALRASSESSDIFASLGEEQNRANVDLLRANFLDRIAQPRAAWRMRLGAIAAISRGGGYARVSNAMAEAVRTEAEHGHYDAALSLADLNIEDLGRHAETPAAGIALGIAQAHRARILVTTGDRDGAQRAIATSRETAQTLTDAKLRAHLLALIDVEDGIFHTATDPQRALHILDSALAFFVAHDDTASLPDIYLQRGRARLRASDEPGALADFESGLRELNEQRSRFDNNDQRSGFYDTEPDLFAETIALSLRRNDIERAFTLSDAARSETLHEQLGLVSRKDAGSLAGAATLPPDAAIVEYALLADDIAIFTITSRGTTVDRAPVNRAQLRARIETFIDAIQRRADIGIVEREAAALFDMLIRPIGGRITGVRRLTIVPDRQLHAVPFAALLDAPRHRYLVDDYVVAVAPSVSYALRKPVGGPATLALVVGDPTIASGPVLPGATREAEIIASMYDAATLLIGSRATRARFIESAERSGIIHYAGHADSDAANTFGTLRLAQDVTSASGDLDAADIARLHLRQAPLVVLAACGTIRGDADHVEGMPSVARAFLAAGARGVVGTLWEIDDEIASPLFRNVHQQLKAGRSPAAALREAQLALAHGADPRLRHPSTWSPVEILGNAH